MSRKTRKLMWSVPLIAAVAVIGVLAAFVTLVPGALFANELSDNPQNLEVTAASGNTGRTTLVLTWEAPASGAPDMYRIDVSEDNEKFTRLTEVSGITLTHSHVVRPRGMDRRGTGGWPRFYRVYAINSHGYGAVSTAESASTNDLAVPGEVTGVKGSSSDPEIVNLRWTAPDDGGSDIWGYCVLAIGPGDMVDTDSIVTNANCLDRFRAEGAGKGNAGGEATDGDVIRILPATSYDHKGLRAEQEWTYKVYAFNRYGHSKTTTAELTIETDEADDPSEPGDLFALQGPAAQVNLYWTAPDDGGQDITSYRVEVSNKNNYWPSASFTTVTSLMGAGNKESGEPLARDPGDPDDEGALVAVFTLAANAQDEVVISTQDALDAHQFQYTPSNAVAGTLYYQVKTITGSGTSEKMSAFTDTKIKVVDHVPGTAEAPETTVQFTPPIPAPGVVADAGETNDSDQRNDDNESANNEDDTKPGVIKLTVTQPTTPDGATPLDGANSYRVDVSDDDGATWTTVWTATKPINEVEYEHKGLKPEEALHFRLFAKKGSDYGLASMPVMDYAGNTDMPTKVRTLEATTLNAGSIKLSWVAPEDDGGADVEQYCIIVNELDEEDAVEPTEVTREDIIAVNAEDATADVTNCSRLGEPENMPISVSGNKVFQVDADTTMATFSSLEQESRWQFQVYALNDASDRDPQNDGSEGDRNMGDRLEDQGRHAVSATSDKISATTDAAVVPGAPQRLSAQFALDNNVAGVGEQGVLLLWNPPANPPGAEVQSYKIERSIDGEDYTVRVSSHTADTTHWADSQEPPESEAWTYRITAINDVGPGTEMATVMIPYPAAGHTHPPAGTALTAPSDVMATFAVTDPGDITVTWTPGENATEGHLVLLFNSDFTEVPHVGVPTQAGMYTISEVTTAGDYVVVVVSVKSRSEYLYDYDRVNVP